MTSGFPGQPYLDQLRPDRGWTVRVALLTAYSADPIAIGATLLALIGRNSEAGSGNAADFAESVEQMRHRFRVIVQRGRLHRPSNLPKIVGVLDQFVIEQMYDEEEESWHPKLALVGYEGPLGERKWRLWIGSRNLTRSRDLDLGLLIEGEARRRKGARTLAGAITVGTQLADLARLPDFPSNLLAQELTTISWSAPDDVLLEQIQLRQAGAASTSPVPEGQLDRFVVLSPFLCPKFVAAMANWGTKATERVLVTTLPAIRGLSLNAKHALKPFRLLVLAPPPIEPEEHTPTPPTSRDTESAGVSSEPASIQAEDEEEEAPPISLHAKLFAFGQGKRLRVVTGSANATDRAWAGRNAEAIVAFEAGPSIAAGISALVGSAMPIPPEILEEAPPALANEPQELLDACRRHIVSHWSPAISRLGEQFTLRADHPPPLGNRGVQLQAGLVTTALLDWPCDGNGLDMGRVPLALQTDLVQFRLALGDVSCSWLQRITVTPEITANRDRAAIARFLGARAFHAWMRGLLEGDVGNSGNEPWERHDGGSTRSPSSNSTLLELTLEDIISAWARNEDAFRRTDARFVGYLEAVLAHDESLTPRERDTLVALRSIWATASSALIGKP